MQRILQLSLLPLTLALWLGCATPQPMVQTTSGNPEITFDTQDMNLVKSTTVHGMSTAGYTLRTDSTFQMSFTKPMEGAAAIGAGILVGNRQPTSPMIEITYTFVNTGSKIQIVATSAIAAQTESGNLKREDMSRSWFNQVQTMLINLKDEVDFRIHSPELYAQNRGELGFSHVAQGEIVAITPGSAAEKAGLRKGDRILKVNGAVVATSSFERSKQLAGPPGTTATLIIRRGKEELTFEITRTLRAP